MPSTEQPSTEPPHAEQPSARPVVFAESDDRADHRLKSGFVPLITGVVIVAAAAVTAAVVFGGGGETRSTPPTGGGLSSGAAKRVAGDDSAGLFDTGSTLAGAGPVGRADGMVREASPRGSATSGSSKSSPNAQGELTVGRIPLALGPGWQVKKQDGDFLLAVNKSERLGFTVEDITVDADKSMMDVLTFWLQDRTQDMTDVRSEDPMDRGLKGKRFPQSGEIEYTAIRSTDKGDYEETGLLVVLMNPRTGQVGLVNVWSDTPDALKSNESDIRNILESMVN